MIKNENKAQKIHLTFSVEGISDIKLTLNVKKWAKRLEK